MGPSGLVPFTYYGPSAPGASTMVAFSSQGTYTLDINHLLVPVTILSNTSVPISVVNPTFQAVANNQNAYTITMTAIAPSTNITHILYTPFGGTVSSGATTMLYSPLAAGSYTHCMIDNTNGCINCKEFIVDQPNALTKNPLEMSLKLFPNPVSSVLFIEGLHEQTTYKIQLISCFGEIAVEEEIDYNTLHSGIPVSNLPDGFYILQIEILNLKKQIFNKHFIIKHS